MTTTGDRVRFAPSPTGFLHIGGVRTALYNWLWAKRTGGTFVLRIEDTDRERSTQASVQAIFDSLKWCDMDWDEGPLVGGPNGPYFQTERLELYADFANQLIDKGAAYRCYATKEELDAERQRQKENGNPFFKYPGWWRDKGPKDWIEGKPYVVRIKAPKSGTTGWNDVVKGRIDVPNDAQQDAVLMRNDGVPLYNFGAVVDDITMGITLVARGDDHVVNTPVQILLYEALGRTVPKFAHLPMILGMDGQKLSKRHAAVSVTEWRDAGYLPDAVLNYLVRLGWSHGDQEVFTRKELKSLFDWDHCGSTAAKFDLKKFAFVQASHLRALPESELCGWVRPFLAEDIRQVPDDGQLALAIGTVKARATTLIEAAQMVDFYFRDTPTEDEKAVTKFLVPEAAANLRSLREHFAAQTDFSRAALEAATTEWMARNGLELKHIAQPARVALTGKSQSPGLYEMLEVLGRIARSRGSIAARALRRMTAPSLATPPAWERDLSQLRQAGIALALLGALAAVAGRAFDVLPATVYGGGFAVIASGLLLLITFFPASRPRIASLHPRVFFLETWRELDAEAAADREARKAKGLGYDYRPLIALCVGAVCLGLMEYFGQDRNLSDLAEAYYDRAGEREFREWEWRELSGHAYWALWRVLGYFVLPAIAMKLAGGRFRDNGLETEGFLEHAWIYALGFYCVVVLVAAVSFEESFQTYYPFYRGSERSWLDFGLWEVCYAAQFFSLEFFFRGWWLRSMRSAMGSHAIFAMVVPYCMIHFGKPFPETIAAIAAGVFLGTLAMKTRSIWSGFLIHVSVAISMDLAALFQNGNLPTEWLPPS